MVGRPQCIARLSYLVFLRINIPVSPAWPFLNRYVTADVDLGGTETGIATGEA